MALTYLDHAASTPMRPEATEAMLPWLTGPEGHGNPSGSHALARRARRAVDDARDQVAEAVGCRPGEVVFTSGGTEADNLAVAGTVARRPGVAVCSAIEHHAVLHPVERAGGRVVRVDARGIVDLDALAGALDPSVTIVSVMAANNETGVVQPVAAVADAVRSRAPQAVVHTDAVQAAAWLDLAQHAAPAHLVSLSAHKLGGPKGVGALIVRDSSPVAPAPLLLGGGQERDRRSGTSNVAGIVGFGAALAAGTAARAGTASRVGVLRDRLVDGLLAAVPGAIEAGVTDVAPDRAHKVAGACHVCFPGVDAEELLFLLDQDGVCASAASSCASGAAEPSHVLAAMGVPREVAAGSLRLSLGWCSTGADVDRALEVVPAAVARLRPVPAGGS
ncbi:MAG: cysteine desulfurase [Actinobacteria bacterium]|nr:cysteine desulfurase [Actinomycetota bacterium]